MKVVKSVDHGHQAQAQACWSFQAYLLRTQRGGRIRLIDGRGRLQGGEGEVTRLTTSHTTRREKKNWK
jgi:hypothetical protein